MNRVITFFRKSTIGQILIFCPIFLLPFQNAYAQDYFQQEVNFEIQVCLNDKLHELNAFETVEYINRSPDTLDFLIFHLWPNGYSSNKTALAKQLMEQKGKSKLFNDNDLKGFIDSLDFKINQQTVQWAFLDGQPDICKIMLIQPLNPGDTVFITTPFRVKIPKAVTSRLGHLETSYQISQWYPKPAVYDRNGWHPMPYLDQGEYYSEFGNYDVSITLPDNYTVGATGNLQSEKEIERLNTLAKDSSWKSTYDTAGYEFPASSLLLKTLRYTENQIHDFAWFADKRFHVMKGLVKLPDSGKEVTTWVLCTNKQAKLWKDAIPYVNNAILRFSNWVGNYPYNSYTAVQSTLNAGIGMEYPGITVIGWVDDSTALDKVIAHEAGHSWFFGALGSDERRYPFMDEGITSAYETRYMTERYPNKKLWEIFFANPKLGKLFSRTMPAERIHELQWLIAARNNLEQPLDLAATDYGFANYGLMIYDKAGMGFNYLRAYLGDPLFDTTMHEYFRVWRFKHPQPDDLHRLFESVTGKDLDWFFKDFIQTTKRLDYRIVRRKGQQLLVRNGGELVSPVVISGIRRDSITFTQWEEGFKGEKWIELSSMNFSEIKIDPLHRMPEMARLNNNIRRLGISPKADPLYPQFLFSIEDPDKRTLQFIPAFNWSKEDGIMAGAVLHNGFFLPKILDYVFTPFYSFDNGRLTGYGKVSYNITPFETVVRKATFSVEGTQFGAPGNQNYLRAKVGLDVHFRSDLKKDVPKHKAFMAYITASDLAQINLSQQAKLNSYLQFGYQLEKTSVVNPFKLITMFEGHSSFQKVTSEFNYRYSYYGQNNGLDIRLFAGGMLKTNALAPFYSLAASGRSGSELYLFEGSYPDRFASTSGSFLSRQMTLSEGGLISPINDRLGFSRWLVSLSMTSDLPGKIGFVEIKPFINAVLTDHGMETGNRSPFFFEAGLKTGIWNLFEISVPFLVSSNIQSMTGSFKDRIRFTFNLDSFTSMKFNLAGLGI